MRILVLASHAVAEYDDVRMFADLGYDVFAPGGYEVPSRSGEGIRPALPDAPHHPELVDRINEVRAERGEPGPAIDWGKAALHADVIDWADVIIVHHFPERWIGAQWGRIRHKRVIWRTCGQSDPRLERVMAGFRREGLQVVRYSPAERTYFEARDAFAGQDAIIRFGKYPADFPQWTGNDPVVGNITQHMMQRGDACGYHYWMAATSGLPATPAGPGSEVLAGGLGELTYERMAAYLQRIRCYLYTGTRPASYTLGLIEAMLAGVPIVSIGAHAWGDEWDGADLFEGHHIARPGFDDPQRARDLLIAFLSEPVLATEASTATLTRALELFDVAVVGPQWQAFLA
jgi:hypothetical protein